MKIKQVLFVTLGCLCLALGTIGVFLPILPTVPFYLLTVFFFAHSSERLHAWFLGTKLYERHLASFARGKGMPMQTKISVMLTLTLLMGFGFFMMAKKGLWLPCGILAVIWLAHVYYFAFRIKTTSTKPKEENT